MNITAELLLEATGCTPERAREFAQPLQDACAWHHIVTPQRLAAFLAQIAHESGGLRYVREIADGHAYEGRIDLGNDTPGDGPRYRGRGLLQITGRANYRDTTRRLAWAQCPDFEADPEALEDPKWAAYSAADWWQAHSLNALADRGEYVAIGRQINRGNKDSPKPANGEGDRLARWERAKVALSRQIGAGEPIVPAPAPVQPPAPAEAPGAAIPVGEATEWPPTVSALQEPVAVTPGPGPSYPDATPAAPPLPPETTMPAPIATALKLGEGLIGALAGDLFGILAGTVQSKITKAVSRHVDPAVAAQVGSAIGATMVQAAQAATGKTDPVVAVAAAKGDPRAVEVVGTSVLDTFERMAPWIDKLAALEHQDWQATEASRDAAAKRASAEGYDMTRPLLIGAGVGVGLMLLGVLAVAIVQLVKAGKIDTEVWAALAGLIGWVTAKAGTIYDYRFGGVSRTSAAMIVRDEFRGGRAP